jgi:hypothetical protein
MLQTEEITASRLKTILMLLGCLAFVGIALWLPREPGQSEQWRWWTEAFFGLGVLIFSWLLVRPQRLILDPEGFTVRGGLVRFPKKVLWPTIDPFFIYRLPRGGKMIGYNFRPGAEVSRGFLTKVARGLGAERALPRLWPGSPDRLVEQLNAYRDQALQTRSNQP